MLPLFPSLPVVAPDIVGAKDSVLFLGRMTNLKGGDVLVKAVSRASSDLRRPIRLVMAGDGPQRSAWKRLAAQERVDADFPGWLDQGRRMTALSMASVLAVPSIWPEPFGLVGLEAAARAVPAVAFDTGGIRQWLRHDVSGLLVPPSDGYRGMASALAALLDKPDLRERLSRGALARAREMSLDAHVDGLERVLLSAARRPPTTAHEAPAHP
jgi:glycosyltransferase involved in cell wall biosynthesis